MFAQKIQNITEQIADLTRKANQYRSLEEEASAVIATITRLHQTASALGEEEEIQKAIAQALGIQASPVTPDATPPEPEVEPEPEQEEAATTDDLERYLDPECLQQAISGDDPDLALMEIASLLDTSHQDDLEERVRFFVEKLPSEMSDRLLGYLPKSIAMVWVQLREKVEADARESLFPSVKKGDSVRIGNEVVEVAHVYLDSQGDTRIAIKDDDGSFQSDLSPNDLERIRQDSEIENIARECLKLKSWSMIRVGCEQKADVILVMQRIASTQRELKLVNNLAAMVVGFVERTKDFSDFEWLPQPLLGQVEALMDQPQVTAIA